MYTFFAVIVWSIFYFLPVFLLCAMVYIIAFQIRMRMKGIRISGKVASEKTTIAWTPRVPRGRVHQPIVEFDYDGELHKVTAKTAFGGLMKPTIGTSLEIIVNPQNPKEVTLAGNGGLVSLSLAFLGGAGFALLAGWFLTSHWYEVGNGINLAAIALAAIELLTILLYIRKKKKSETE